MLRIVQVAFFLVAFAAARLPAAPFVPARDAQCVAFSPDGKLAATGISGLSNGEYPPRPHPSVRKSAAIQIWDVASGQKLRRMETYGDLTKIEFTNDGKSIVSARLFTPGEGTPLNEVCIWETATGKPQHRFEGCHAFALGPRGESIAVLSRSRCVIYEGLGRNWLREIKPLGSALSVVYSPDGKFLAGICPVDAQFAIRTYDVEMRQTQAQSATLEQPFYTLAVESSGRLLASGHPGGVLILWDAQSLKPVARMTSGGRGRLHPFFSPDGTELGGGDQENGDVVFWSTTQAQAQELRRFTFERGSFRTHLPRPETDRIRPEKDPTRFVFSPDGETFLAGCFGGIVRLRSSGQETRRFGD